MSSLFMSLPHDSYVRQHIKSASWSRGRHPRAKAGSKPEKYSKESEKRLALAISLPEYGSAFSLIEPGGFMIINKSNFSRWTGAQILVLALALFAGQSVFASPATEINRAVNGAGATDAKHAMPATFMQGFNAVIITVKQADAPRYVSEAVKMRTDLAPQITVATLNARARNRHSCEEISAIIKAAIAAAAHSRYAITRAVLAAQPTSRQCVLDAAGISDKDLRLGYTKRSDDKQVLRGREAIPPPAPAFPYSTIWDVGNIISINPGPGGAIPSASGRAGR